MRVTNIILFITGCLAMVGAYIAGHYMGEFAGRDVGADVSFNLDASRSAEAFAVANSIRQALRESKPAKADALAARYAALKVPSLAACQASPECVERVGRLMPTKAQLDEVLAAEKAMRAASGSTSR